MNSNHRASGFIPPRVHLQGRDFLPTEKMAASQNSSHTVLPYKKPGGTRKVWTRPEEDALINALKELIVNSWRSDNAFKPGYLRQLESAIKIKFPHFNITGNRHINSKLTVWKKTYGQVYGMCETSGFSYNDTTNMIDIASDDVWETYVKAHKDVETFRYKSFPLYRDWYEIFGRDRADGGGGQQCLDAVLDLEYPHPVDEVVYDVHVQHGARGKSTEKHDSSKVAPGQESEQEDDAGSVLRDATGSGSKSGKNTRGGDGTGVRKRRRREPLPLQLPEQFVSMLGGFFNEANKSLEGLASKIVSTSNPAPPPPPPPSPHNKTKQIMDIVGKMGNLQLQVRISVAHKIINNAGNTDMFLMMDEHCQAAFVQMIISNQL